LSVRSRSIAAGVATAALRCVGVAAALPAAAAATATAPHTAPLPLAVSFAKQGPHRVPTPGGAAAEAVLTVTDTTGKAEQFSDDLGIRPTGHVFPRSSDVAVRVTPVAGTPAVPGIVDGWSKTVTIPAHATFTWKVSVEATKTFQPSDEGFGVEVGVLGQ